MAGLLFYGSSSVALWFVGKNIVSRAANNALDLLLNSNAVEILKDPKAVNAVSGLLHQYRNLKSDHIAYEAMINVREAMKRVTDVTEQAKLRKEVHENGYFSRWRTYDASSDNRKILGETEILLARLEIFTNLLKHSD